jgi:hypothetical protein
MSEMTPFRYRVMFDVPRWITLRYKERLLLLQSAFDENLDDYPSSYSVYVLPDAVEDALRGASWLFLENTPLTCIGKIPIRAVVFDPSRRKELDATCLDSLLADHLINEGVF